jgi:hypothetical protein
MFPRNVERLPAASGEEELECIRRSERTFELRILVNTVACRIQKNKEIKEKGRGVHNDKNE